ncbi:hypothetical protein [Schlesneria paludicola]|uniref:hypothetical protein n=1 Tax=Schlesneria paludicola TaxID=360056 RepID=UPI00029A95DC|nr:hypothetical protein [Schlesneria paludicola]
MVFENFRRRRFLQISATTLNALVIVGGAVHAGAPIPPAPAFTSPDIKPTFADWLTARPIALAKKIRLTDPLLKPPFAAAPPDSLKGMAAGIRAVQLDVPNRVKAVQYLGTLDCVTYPQAQDMLIATMLEDPSEIVRYEAVMALRNMLTRGCCNMNTVCECETCANRKQIVRETERHAKKGERLLIKEAKGPAKKEAKKAYRDRESEEQRYDCCRGCSNEKVMKALAKVASEKDDECCWVEPSERVRDAARDAMCLFKNYSDGYMLPEGALEPIPSTDESGMDGEVEPSNEGEVAPEKKQDDVEAKPDASASTSAPRPKSRAKQVAPNSAALKTVAAPVVPQSVPAKARPTTVQNVPVQPQSVLAQSVAVPVAAVQAEPEFPELNEHVSPIAEYPVVPGLKGRCIVGLKMRQVLPVDPRFSSVYEERTYYFSSAEAKAAFDQAPRQFALAYGGLDPVSWLSNHKMVDGEVLREFEGQFFLFENKDNWETFKGNPARYVLRSSEPKLNTVAGTR